MRIREIYRFRKNSVCLLSALFFLYGISSPVKADLPLNTSVAGDSITMGFAANCTGNTTFGDLLCLIQGDQPTRSWFDGSSSDVDSVHDKYKREDDTILANKLAARSGSEMLGSDNNFAAQAAAIVAQNNVPDHVQIFLGSNDICNRSCTDPANCNDPLYSEEQWREAVRAGLDTLVQGLPEGSTVYFGSLPRIQDLHAAGLDKQASNSRVNCDSVWSTFNICRIATDANPLNGESLSQRLQAIADTQRRYNEIIREEAIAYNANSNGRNTRGIEVISEYVDEMTPTTGTFQFSKDDIDGGDCFHPNIQGQNTIAEMMWNSNTDR